ncbi:hypothetical protein BKA66DRAFT_473962 [Pyrenochaeta sp. MPI-SDFR-AT-0127]|nr:hypothetical protein BKA66DRAFT_473962 [Pyrenochaeta sp. MPI-SDFR-AT-0127]
MLIVGHRTVTAIVNQWVTLASGSTSYTLGSTQTAATKFFINKYNATNTYAFHNADDTRQLALQGTNGTLLYLVDVTNPRADTIPGGQLMEWATFTTNNNILGVNDGSTLQNRTFASVGGQLALYDGELHFSLKDDRLIGFQASAVQHKQLRRLRSILCRVEVHKLNLWGQREDEGMVGSMEDGFSFVPIVFHVTKVAIQHRGPLN